MDAPWNVTSRWSKKYSKSLSQSNDEKRYLLSEDDVESVHDSEVLVHSGFSRLNNNSYGRPRKAKEEDEEMVSELLVSIPGRPPAKPPTDQCVEAEIQPGDTLASIALRFSVPVAELKRVNRLLNDKDLFAKRSVKIPIKPASLLTETFPLSGEATNAAVLNLCEEIPRRAASPNHLPAETPAVRRAMNFLTKIDNDVRLISQRQDDLQQQPETAIITGSDVIEIEPIYEEKPSWLDRLNTNKKWIAFYAILIVAAVCVILMLTRYETRVLSHQSPPTTTTAPPCGPDLNCQRSPLKPT